MTRSEKSPKHRPKGYDFGTDATDLVLASHDFIEAFSMAGITGCLYGVQRSDVLATELPLVSILGSNEEKMVAGFTELQRWSNESRDDAIELTFVFLTDGGCLLGISPRYDSLRRRLCRNVVHQPLLFAPVWIKKFDSSTTGMQLRRYQIGRASCRERV